MTTPIVPVPRTHDEAVALATDTLIALHALQRRWRDYERRHHRQPDPLRQLAISEPPALLAPAQAPRRLDRSIPNQEA